MNLQNVDFGRTIALSIIAAIYAIVVAATIYFEVGIYLVLTLPWSIFIFILVGINMHNGIGNTTYWFLSAALLNILIFLWVTAFKPMLIKIGEIPD